MALKFQTNQKSFRWTGIALRLGLGFALGWLPLLANPHSVSASPPPASGTQVFLPVVIGGAQQQEPPPPPDPAQAEWLEYLNYFRAMAGLNPISENTDWGTGTYNHSRYMVKNDFIGHSENPSNPWYTPEGAQAAQSSNLAASHSTDISDTAAIDLWIQAPFHAVGVLDPKLHQVGYGSFREADGGLQMGASLDVLRGLGSLPADISFPIAWPGEGSIVPLTSHTTEYPDPLSSCPGYVTPAGLPIILQIGSGDQTPDIKDHSLYQGSTPLEHCIFDETSYTNGDASAQELARAILGARDAIVLIPRQPLAPGATYRVSISLASGNYSWSFSVADIAAPEKSGEEGLIFP